MPRPAPDLPALYATVQPGLETIAAEEITRDLGGEVRKSERGLVVFRVDAITPATASSFSPLPTNNSSGTFTKVTQLIPVRIAVELGNRPALLGTSVEVKIRVAD